MRIYDPYGRPLEGLRISVTNRCNHRCIFCHMEGSPPSEGELGVREYRVLSQAASRLGIREYKITGGEPLLRKDILGIVEALGEYGGEVSMTTNGSLLSKYAVGLAERKLHHLNVSLHSLNPEKFNYITRGRLQLVLEGITAALDAGLDVRLNVTLLRHNADEVPSIIDYAERLGLNINIVDVMPLFYYDGGKLDPLGRWRELRGNMDAVEKTLERRASRIERRYLHNRRVYVMPSGIRVTVIKGFMNPDACSHCTRMRVTPDGKVKPCLYRPPVVDLRPALIVGDVDSTVSLLIKANNARRPFFTWSNIGEYRMRWGLDENEA